MTPLLAAVLGFFLSLGTAAHAQQQLNLSNLPPNTVVGRLGSSVSGPAQAVPISSVATSGPITNSGLALMPADTFKCNATAGNATPTDCTATTSVNTLSAAPWNDLSTTVGSLSTYYTSTNPNAIVDHFNRAFVGEANKNNTGNDSSGTFSWVEGLIPLVASSQLAIGNAVGQIGATGYSRCSDNFTASGNHTSNCLGLVGFGYQDDTVSGNQAAQGATLVAAMKSTATTGSAIAAQLDVNNAITSAPVVNPNSTTPNGVSMSVLLTPGAYSTLGTHNASAAMVIGPSGQGASPVFNAGIVVGTGDIASTSGTLGNFARALELPAASGISWFSTGSTEVEAITGDSSGNLSLAATNLKINNTAAVSCGAGTVNLTTFVVTAGIVTHC